MKFPRWHLPAFPRLKYKQEGVLTFIDYKRKRFLALYWVMLIFLIICLIVSLFPLIWLFISAFKSTAELNSNVFHFWPANFNIGKIIDVWQATNMGIYFVNTIIVVLGAVICAVLFNGLLAYGISVVKPAGSKFIYWLIMASYMIPSVLSIVPLFSMIVNLKLINTFIPLWFCFGANCFYFVNFKNYFDKIPTELVEAMRVDGGGDLTIFFRLILPISRPIIGIVAIFAVSASWSDFLLPKLVLTQDNLYTIMVKLFSINATMGTVEGYTPDMLLMALMISTIPQIVLFMIFQRQIIGGGTDGSVKG